MKIGKNSVVMGLVSPDLEVGEGFGAIQWVFKP
jgi:hypothetical protein